MKVSDLVTNLDFPFWDDCRPLLSSLLSGGFPSTELINRCLPAGLTNQHGQRIRFVSSATLPGVQYEQHILDHGEVSTRPDSWHDLFNALAWMQFPAIKSALNVRHCAAMKLHGATGRGTQRDALTLFDECGLVVASTERASLEDISSHRWSEVFAGGVEPWAARFRLLVTGHAMREKLLKPYKAMTANALLVHVSERLFTAPMAGFIEGLDSGLGQLLGSGRLLQSPLDLAHLPLMGIPGWWPGGGQDVAFYADSQVFRARAPGQAPARVVPLTNRGS